MKPGCPRLSIRAVVSAAALRSVPTCESNTAACRGGARFNSFFRPLTSTRASTMSSTPQPTPSSSSNHPLTSTEYTLPNPPQHPISSIVFHPDPSSSSQLSRQFLTSSWDSTVRLYQLADVDANNASSSALSGEAKAQVARQVHSFQHEAPVLDVCWITPTLAASGGIDRRVRLLNLEDGSSTILGKHGSAICRMRYEASTNLLISASWDKTLKLWDPTAVEPRLLKTLTLPEKPLAMDVSPPWTASPLVPKEGVKRRLVVAMAARQVRIYDLEDLRRRCDAMSGEDDGEQWDPEQTRESSLKYMVRDVRCNVDGIGECNRPRERGPSCLQLAH